jgi:homoserine O-succinyltransferase
MEPNTVDLRQELLWSFFTDVFDWAEFNAVPTVLSCLAAHAAVLHTDGIIRIPLSVKRFGVFQHNVVSRHPLARGLPSSLRAPHSRWNELDKNMLADYGYQVLTYSAQAGVDIFVKQRRSLFVHFQGHPEYGIDTLFGEYRRDIRRFLAREQDCYPSLPEGYFSKAAEARLNAFRERAFCERREELWQQFPRQLAPTDRTAPWGAAATKIIHNLLNYIGERND